MIREELLKIAKPVLFNTEMVKAILEGRKTVTRRIVKFQDGKNPNWTGYIKDGLTLYNGTNEPCNKKPPFKKGDYLYVRETWCKGAIDCGEEADGRDVLYVSQCEGEDDYILKAHALHENIGIEDVVWRPSIHMPKEAARIFLKVTDVRVERLQDMEEEDAIKEGIHPKMCPNCTGIDCDLCSESEYTVMDEFMYLWNSTIKKADLDKYGWEANPWVWVIEFERVEV